MKVWMKNGKMMGYESDFPSGVPGWELVEKRDRVTIDNDTSEIIEDRDAVSEAYEAKFGKKPHHKMSIDNIRKAVEQ